MNKSKDYKIPIPKIKSGIKKTLFGSLEIIGYAKDLLERGGNPDFALGFYLMALEEYGKSIILRESLKQGNTSASISKKVFENTDVLFKKAFALLPKKCILSLNHDLDNQENLISDNLELRNSLKTRTIDSDIILNFEIVKMCFHLTWNESENKWSKPPRINHDELMLIIQEFSEFISAELDSAHDFE